MINQPSNCTCEICGYTGYMHACTYCFYSAWCNKSCDLFLNEIDLTTVTAFVCYVIEPFRDILVWQIWHIRRELFKDMLVYASLTKSFVRIGQIYIPAFLDVRVEEGHHVIKLPPLYFGGSLAAGDTPELPPALHEGVTLCPPLSLPVSSYRDQI